MRFLSLITTSECNARYRELGIRRGYAKRRGNRNEDKEKEEGEELHRLPETKGKERV